MTQLNHLLMLASSTSGEAQSGGGFLFPPAASTIAEQTDGTFMFLLGVSGAILALVVGSVLFFLVWYNRATTPASVNSRSESGPLELLWTLVPAVLVVALFWSGFKGYVNSRVAPSESYEIRVKASQWKWEFTYPNGAVTAELHVPLNQPIALLMESSDVTHSLSVPAFRLKQDILPDRTTTVWFEATLPGTYELFCAEYCGVDYASQRTHAVVEGQRDFETWLAASVDLYAGLSPAEAGKKVAMLNACSVCHSPDGAVTAGPTWLNMFGSTRKTSVGDVVADEAYVKESILNPLAKIVEGYPPVMVPIYQGRVSDKEIGYLIAYMKTLKSE